MVKTITIPEQKLREIAQALVFLASVKAVMEKEMPEGVPPSLPLIVAYIRTYVWLIGQIRELFKNHSCEKGECKQVNNNAEDPQSETQ
jgi:hypothetical protein